MSLEFLTDRWFAKLEELRAEGDVEAPADLTGHVINLTIQGGPGGDVEASLVEGTLAPGHRAGAPVTMVLHAHLAKRMLIEEDPLAGLQGYMAGQIRLEGDATALRLLRSTSPTPSQRSLQSKIRRWTA
jgi:hypothetical protein